MNRGKGAGDAPLLRSAEERAERRRMSFYDLFFLAAGGVIGSGWLLGTEGQGMGAVYAWLIGGALILVVMAVMVELSTRVPKTGGLIFLPLQSSGPLFATVVAAAMWVFYAVNPASESVAMVNGLSDWDRNGLEVGPGSGSLTLRGLTLAALFLILIAAVNLLGPRLFLMINNVLTAFKILVPLLVVALLGYAWLTGSSARYSRLAPTSLAGGTGASAVLAAVSGSVIYAYLGFQGPLDLAGNVRRRGVGEVRRLRWAVYGTVVGSIMLYAALQLVVVYMQKHSVGHVGPVGSVRSPFRLYTLDHSSGVSVREPYVLFVKGAAPPVLQPVLEYLIHLDSVLSPAGAGMVFTYAMTTEVAALSRAHLVHRGLQHSRYSVIPLASQRLRRLFRDDRLDVFWLIILVDLVLSAIALVSAQGQWTLLGGITSVLGLIVYSTQSVVLAALRRHDAERFPRLRYVVLAEAAFVAISVLFCLNSGLWRATAGLGAGCLLLFGLPLVLPGSRWYDATPHARWFRHLATGHPAARSAALLLSYFAGLTAASLAISRWWLPWAREWPHWARGWADAAGILLIAVLASLVFRRLVTLSAHYMAGLPPTLPPPPGLRRGSDRRPIRRPEP